MTSSTLALAILIWWYVVCSFSQEHCSTLSFVDKALLVAKKPDRSGLGLVVIEDGLVMYVPLFKIKTKWLLLDKILRDLVSRLWKEDYFPKSLVLPFHIVSNPPVDTPCTDNSCSCKIPVLTIAKTPQHGPEFLLYPNPYFLPKRSWDKLYTQLLAAGNSTPWESRPSVAFWRGKCKADFFSGCLPRLKLSQLARKDHEHLLDVGLQGGVPSAKAWSVTENITAAEAKILARENKRFVAQAAFSQMGKYLISMPGQTRASYSRGLQFLFPTGSLVLKWRNSWDEFYYQYLIRGVHYDLVDEHDLFQVIKYYQKHDHKAKLMGEAARAFFREHLSSSKLDHYWITLFQEYEYRVGPVSAVDSLTSRGYKLCSCSPPNATIKKCGGCK